MMNNKEIKIIKNEILHYLTDDFKENQAIFNKKEGWQIFNGTDLSMVMDKVVAGLYSAKKIIDESENKKLKQIIDNQDFLLASQGK